MFDKYHKLYSKSPLAGPTPCLIPESQLMLSHMPPVDTHPRVVDVGSGQGGWSERLRDKGYTVSSVDLDPSQYPPTIKAEMHELPFGDNSQDVIFCTGTFEHSYAPFVLLHEFRRVLRHGGYILISLPMENNVKMLNDVAHMSILSRLQMEEMLFKKLDMTTMHWESGNWDDVVGPHQIFVVLVDKSKPNKY